MVLQAAQDGVDKDDGDDCGQKVADGEGCPHSVQTVEGGEDEKERDEENYLTGQPEEDTHGGFAERLEQ